MGFHISCISCTSGRLLSVIFTFDYCRLIILLFNIEETIRIFVYKGEYMIILILLFSENKIRLADILDFISLGLIIGSVVY